MTYTESQRLAIQQSALESAETFRRDGDPDLGIAPMQPWTFTIEGPTGGVVTLAWSGEGGGGVISIPLPRVKRVADDLRAFADLGSRRD